MTKEKITLVVDDRENADVVAAVSQHDEVDDWYIDRLDVGDIQCERADVLFERKTMSDYAGSLRGGRLNEQVDKMRETTDNTYILVEDNLSGASDLEQTAMRPQSIRGSMASVMARDATPVIPCSDIELLVDMAVRISRKYIEEPGSAHLGTPDFSDDEPVVKKMYACLPDIGPKKAGVLYDEYPQVGGLIATSKEDIADIEGFGEKTAKKIKAAIHGE